MTHSASTATLDADRERDLAVEQEIRFSEAQQDQAIAGYEKYRTFIDNDIVVIIFFFFYI